MKLLTTTMSLLMWTHKCLLKSIFVRVETVSSVVRSDNFMLRKPEGIWELNWGQVASEVCFSDRRVDREGWMNGKSLWMAIGIKYLNEEWIRSINVFTRWIGLLHCATFCCLFSHNHTNRIELKTKNSSWLSLWISFVPPEMFFLHFYCAFFQIASSSI